MLARSALAGALPEYNAAEAKKHIGETARVTDKVGCALGNRHGGYNLGMGGCDAQTPFWIVTHGDISGPKLDVSELKGVVVTVTGKIDNDSGVARIFVKSTSQIAPHEPKHVQAEATVQQSAQDSSEPNGSTSRPKSAEVVDIPAAQAQFGIKAGNIKVSFSDGNTAVITSGGNCMYPHVSTRGDVGWVHCTGFDRKGYAQNDKVIVRLSSGAIKEFRPDAKAPFIGAWTFVDDNSGIVIQSMSFHGPSSYIRYDMVSGKVTNKKDGSNDSEPPPKWAQPLSH
jgi:hypothetical protein